MRALAYILVLLILLHILDISLATKSPSKKKTKGVVNEESEDHSIEVTSEPKKKGKTLATKTSAKTVNGVGKASKNPENNQSKSKKSKPAASKSSDNDESAPKGRTTTPNKKQKEGEPAPKGRTLSSKTKKADESEAAPKGRTVASKTKKQEEAEPIPKGKTAASKTKKSDGNESEPKGKTGPKGRTLVTKKPEGEKSSPIKGRMLAPDKKALTKADLAKAKQKDDSPPAPTAKKSVTTKAPQHADSPDSPESGEDADIITTTPKPMKKWGPTKNGTYTEEGIYIETIYLPDKCDKVSRKGDYVTTEYIGQFPNGKKFDSTFDREEPMRYRLGDGQVIEGSEIATTGMCVGEIRRTIIPPKYAYGDKKYGQIPAGW
ncbi:hypothetical protein Ocin01_05175 [Orchesella cincta]|uniref:peptidylprolyl isomerase n=1 Tax=Orchesella cincta TaxID=48709 RepID=A0A1D2N8E7_ORCCI|nr:hypothetical protein Ocin01_05175 [Orchesella cincta]